MILRMTDHPRATPSACAAPATRQSPPVTPLMIRCVSGVAVHAPRVASGAASAARTTPANSSTPISGDATATPGSFHSPSRTTTAPQHSGVRAGALWPMDQWASGPVGQWKKYEVRTMKRAKWAEWASGWSGASRRVAVRGRVGGVGE